MPGGFVAASSSAKTLVDAHGNVIPPPKNNVFGYLIAFAAAMGGLLFGYEIGVISQVLGMLGFQLQFGMVARLQDVNHNIDIGIGCIDIGIDIDD